MESSSAPAATEPCCAGTKAAASADRLSLLEEKARVGEAVDGSEMVTGLIKALSGALVYPDLGNFETNKRLWNRYAEEWSPSTEWVADMAGHVGEEATGMEFVGEEWSRRGDVDEVVRDFVQPYVGKETVAAEVGVGGGRVAAKVLPLVASLTCMDISRAMLERARAALTPLVRQGDHRLSLVLLDSPSLPTERFAAAFDFVYCFDVMVHMDLHLTYHYFRQVYAMLKPGGKAFFSTANLLAPGGWERFEKQSKYTVGGFYFLSPDMVNHLLTKAGFTTILKSSLQLSGQDPAVPRPSNVYYDRDYLVVVQKAEGGS